MPVSPTVDIHSVTVGKITQNTLYVPLSTVTNAKTIETQALINCGAGGMFIDQNFAQNFKIHLLTKPITAWKVDGTINKKGTIKFYVKLEFVINSTKFRKWFYVTGVGKQIDKELVPQGYHEYLDIFSEEKAARFHESRSWDHKIKMNEGFGPKSFKNYNLTPAEQLKLDKFLKENLEKGYIWPSQSPMASPFFLVSKKDGKLRPCQDYRYLNNWTITNSYPLPLISDILDKLKGAKYFMKLYVRWGYNNICIHEQDEWKAAFKTNKGLFEPTVMFLACIIPPWHFKPWWMTFLLKWSMENW